MELKALLYRINHDQIPPKELGAQTEEKVRLVYRHLLYMGDLIARNGLAYFDEQHLLFISQLQRRIRALLLDEIINSPVDANSLDVSLFEVLKSFVMRSSLEVYPTDIVGKRKKLLAMLKDIKERINHSLDLDLKDSKSSIRPMYRIGYCVDQIRIELNNNLDTIEKDIQFIYNRDKITNMDLDFLHMAVANNLKKYKKTLQKMYAQEYKLSHYNRSSIGMTKSKTGSPFPLLADDKEDTVLDDPYLPRELGKFFYKSTERSPTVKDEKTKRKMPNQKYYIGIPDFLQAVYSDLRFRFDPLRVDENKQFITRIKDQAIVDTELGENELRRPLDDIYTELNSVRLGPNIEAYTSCGQSDPKIEQEDTVSVTAYYTPNEMSAFDIADLLYETIQHFVDIKNYAESQKTGSTLNWTVMYDGKVINANVGDSIAYLVTRNNADGALQLQPLNWKHRLKIKSEKSRLTENASNMLDDNPSEHEGSLSRAIGGRGCYSRVVSATPDFSITELSYGQEAYVLSVTSGLSRTMNMQDIEAFLNRNGLEGNVANALRMEAFKRYKIRRIQYLPGQYENVIDLQNITVAFAPMTYNDKQMVISRVHDGHEGPSVAKFLRDNFDEYLLAAARLHRRRILPMQLNGATTDVVERSLMGRLDDAIALVDPNSNPGLYYALLNFKNKVRTELKNASKQKDAESYLNTELVQLIHAVIDAVHGAYQRDINMDEYLRYQNNLMQMVELTQSEEFQRAATWVLVGLGVTLLTAVLLTTVPLSGAAASGTAIDVAGDAITTFAPDLITAGGSLISGGVASLLTLWGINSNPQEQQRQAGYKVGVALPKPCFDLESTEPQSFKL